MIPVQSHALSTGDIVTTTNDTSEVYTIVDTMPEIIGGIQKVYDAIEYPEVAVKANIEGRVFVKFIIDENGKVQDPQVLKDIGAGCGEAAVKGLLKVKFTPGLLGDKPVKVYYTLPITFKLE
jgi:protein TonB